MTMTQLQVRYHKEEGKMSFGSEKKTSLIEAAKEGDSDLIEDLLNKGEDPNEIDHKRQTPLMHAAKSDHDLCVLQLLAHPADVFLQDETGSTALDLAISSRSRDCTILLLEYW